MARRVRRLFRGGRVVDVAGGHGVLGHMMLILDDSSSDAIVADRSLPPSSAILHAALVHGWPRLAGRVTFSKTAIADIELQPSDLVVSCHACGALTDTVLNRAVAARARVAVLPCCHDRVSCNAGRIGGWVDDPLAIDIMRAVGLEQRGYRVWTQSIPATITPKNRLLIAEPAD